MKQCMDAQNLHRRLKKIIGQVQAVDRMIDEDIPCEDILAQINAAKSALHKAGQVILEGHIKHCVRDGIEHGDADKTIANFIGAAPSRGLRKNGLGNSRPFFRLMAGSIALRSCRILGFHPSYSSLWIAFLLFFRLFRLDNPYPYSYNIPIPI